MADDIQLDNKDLYWLNKSLEELKDSIQNLEKHLDSKLSTFVTQSEFAPVKAIAYSIVGVICLGALTAILATIYRLPIK